MLDGRIKKFKIPFDNRVETFLEDHRLQKNEYLCGMTIEDIDMMTVDVDLLLEYFNFVNDSYSNTLLILCQDGFDMFFNYVRLFNAVDDKDQEKIFNCVTVLTEKSADIFKNYSKCVREDFVKHKKEFEETGNGYNARGGNTQNEMHNKKKNSDKRKDKRNTIDLEATTDEEEREETQKEKETTKEETSHMKNVFLKNSIMKLIVMRLDNNMMEYATFEKSRGCNVLEIKESLVSYFHVLTFFFINMFNMYYNKYFGKRPKLDFVGTGQRGRKKQKKALDEETCLNLKNMNTLLNNIILLICSVDFYVIYDKINIIILDLYLEFFLNVYFLNQECNNAFNMDIYYDQLAEVIFNLLQLYVKRDREEILLDYLDEGNKAEPKMADGKNDKSKISSGKAAKDGETDLSHLKPVILEYISYSFADVYLETCKKCNNVRMVDAVLMLRNTNMAAEILRELYIYIKKNASVCVNASAQSRVQVEMNNVLTFVEYFSKNLSYQFVTFVKESVNLLGVDVPNVRKTIIDCFKNILMLAKAAEEWRERMIRKMARAERRKKDKRAAGEDTDSAKEYSDDENEEENYFNEMEEEEEEEDKEMYDEEEDEEESEEETIGDEGAEKNKTGTRKGKGRPQLNIIKRIKRRGNMNAFLKSSSSGKVKPGGKNIHMTLMNKMLLHDERFLAICFDKCLRAREYSIYLLLTRQHDCKLHVRCHLLKIFSELVEGDFIPVIYYNDLCLICRERISDKSPLVRQRAFSLLSSIATDVVKKKYMMPLDTERIKKDLDLLIRRKVLLRKKAKEEKQIVDKDQETIIEDRKKKDHDIKALDGKNEVEDQRKNRGHRSVSTNSNGHTKKRKMNLSGSDTDSDEEKGDYKQEKKKKRKDGETEEIEGMEQNKQPKKTNETTTEKPKEMTELEKNIGKYDMVIQMYNDVLYIATLVDECVKLCFRLLYSVVETDQKSSIKFIILAHLCGNKLAGKQMNQVWSLIYSTNSVIVDIIIQEFLKVNIEPSDYRISAFRLINITLHSKLKDVACIEKIIQSILMQGKAAINVGKLLDELFKIVFIDTFSESKNAAIKEGGLILMKMICFSIYVTHKRRGDEVQYHTLFTEENMKDVMMFIKTFRHNFHFLNTLALILKYNETTRAVQYCMLALFNWLFLKLKLDNRHRWRPIETLSKKDYTQQKGSLDSGLDDTTTETDKQKTQIISANLPNASDAKQIIGKEKLLEIEKERTRLRQKLLGNYNYLADTRCKWFKFAQSVIEGMCEHFRTFNKLVARKMRLALKNFFRVRRVVVTTPKKIYELSSIKRHTKYRLERRYRSNITCFTLVKILFLYGHIGVYSLIHSEKIINQLKDYPCEIDNFGMYTKDEQDREYFDFVVEEKIVCDNLLGKKIVPLLFRIVRGPNTFYKKYALRKKHQGKWKLKKMMRKLQVQSIQDKNERAKGNTTSINDGRITRARILKAIIKYIETARRKKRKRIKIRKMKRQIARRKRRKMLRKMELVLSKNVDKMSPKQIKKFLIKMKEIKRWRKNRKEKIIYRRYEMYLLFLVSLLSLCKYAIISLQFCKKKVTKHMTLIQLIVAVIVKEYKPIFSRVQRRDNFFKQGKVKVDSFGRILNLSLKPSTGFNAEVTRARVMVFGTQKQQAIMERQRQRLEKWEQKRSVNKTLKMHPLAHKKEAIALSQATEKKRTSSGSNTGKVRRSDGIHMEKYREMGTRAMKKTTKHNTQVQKKMAMGNKKGYCMSDATLINGGKKVVISGGKAGMTQVRKIRIKKVGGKIVRKTLIKNMGDKKQKVHIQDVAGNAEIKKVGRRPGRPVGSTTVARNAQRKADTNSIEKEGKKRGRKPKTKKGVQNTTNVSVRGGINAGEQLEGIRLRKKKKLKVKMGLRRKKKTTKVIDAQAQVMKKSVVNLRRMLLISYADLLYRHPNLLEPHNLEIFNVLSDTDVSIRKTAVAVFTHLYMTDTVKAKTVLLVHMMFLTADADEKISGGAKSFFYELDRKAHNTLANNIADMITLIIKNERQWPHEKNKGIIEFLLYFMKKSKYSESLSEKIIRKMAEVELQNKEALNLYSLVFIHIHMDEKVLQRILGCISLIKHVIRENEYVYEKFIQVSKRAGEKRRGRPVDEAHQAAGARSASTLYPDSGGKDFSERNEGKMKELADQLYCEVESARQNVSAWSIMIPSSAMKKRYSKGKGAWDPSPGKKDKDKDGTPKKKDGTPKKRDSTTPKRTDSTPQRMNSNPKTRSSVSRKSNSFFNDLNKTPSIM